MSTRILYVTTYEPDRSDLGGASWVDRRLIWRLAEQAEVVVHPLTGADEGLPLSVRESRADMARTLARMVAHGEPYQAAKFRFHRNYERVLRQLREIAQGYDFVVSSQWPALLALSAARVDVALHIAHNVDWVLSEQHDPQLLRLLRNASRMRRLERRLLGWPGSVVTLSANDARRLRRTGIFAQPLRLIEPIPTVSSVCHRSVGLLGKMSWPPNYEAAVRLRDEILPAVNGKLAQPVTLLLAGSGSQAFSRGKNVHALGVVNDVQNFYDAVDVVVVPRVDGQTSGISIKLAEAVEAGKPVIAPSALFADCGLDSPWGRDLDNVASITDALTGLYDKDATADAPPSPRLARGGSWVEASSLMNLMASHTRRRSSVEERPAEVKLVASPKALTERMLGSAPSRVQTLNLHHLYLARQLPDFRKAVLEADAVTADGWPVHMLLKRNSDLRVPRVTGSDFLVDFVSDPRVRGLRFALIGGSAESADGLRARLEETGAEFAGGWHGAREDWNPADVARDMNEAAADIVLVAVTPPYGELFAAELRRLGVTGRIISIGGGLDMLVGARRRAPEWLQALRLEWAFRMLQDPRALFKRYVLECIPEFVNRVFRKGSRLV